ncbi:MAG: hypothetical protein KME45_29125 [Stenomitos rutilans HA7619-LM2]|jgi:hypothetical protein|nr:hypothetical protein [Stenomitos rutilans HA7619-LM2]
MVGTKHSVARTAKPYPIAFVLAAIGLVIGVSQAALAQEVQPAQPQQIFQDQQTRDPFSSRGNDQTGGVMDLIHRAMQAGSTSNEDFVGEQQENLDSATAAFREAQKKRLTGTSTPPVATPGTATPTN